MADETTQEAATAASLLVDENRNLSVDMARARWGTVSRRQAWVRVVQESRWKATRQQVEGKR